jgi:hypothetical protein
VLGVSVLAVLGSTLGGCEAEPERQLAGCWGESSWRYERVSEPGAAMGIWNDGVRLREYPDRRVARHEAEHWEFHPDGHVDILTRDGGRSRARWRLKGRGHVMTLRFPQRADEQSAGFEVYRVQELDDERLILHYDVGMQVRGVARIEFRRLPGAAGHGTCPAPSADDGAADDSAAEASS